MKQLFAIFMVSMLAAGSLQAQYKKASFFNKTGRIYDVGTNFRLLGDGRTSTAGFFISAGKEKTGKRIHHWFDFETNLGTKFNYVSPDENGVGTVKVTCKAPMDFTFKYTLGYFLADNSNEDVKLLPFVNLNTGYVFGTSILALQEGEPYTTEPINRTPTKEPIYAYESMTFGVGGGVLYRINNRIGIRGSINYNAVVSTVDYGETFSLLPNHPSISLGVRFRMDRDD